MNLFLTVASLLPLFPAWAAQQIPAPAVPAQNSSGQDIQTRADALLSKARQLSDIRSPDAPPFRLKATFSFTGKDLGTVQGT